MARYEGTTAIRTMVRYFYCHEVFYRDSVYGLQDGYVSGILEEHEGRACKRRFSLHPFLACLLLYFT